MGQSVCKCCQCADCKNKSVDAKHNDAPLRPLKPDQTWTTESNAGSSIDQKFHDFQSMESLDKHAEPNAKEPDVITELFAIDHLPNDQQELLPTFVRTLKNMTVRAGTIQKLFVELRGSTEFTVSWYRNDTLILTNDDYSVVKDGNIYAVNINCINIEDNGRWTCAAESTYGRVLSSCFLQVIVPKSYKKPVFYEELEALLTEEGTVSLQCKVVGVPTPILRWFKDGREIKAGDMFALSVNHDDQFSLGTYTCEASNCMGKAYSSSKVNVSEQDNARKNLNKVFSIVPSGQPPIFTKELKNEKVKIGESFILTCQVVVPPYPKSIKWQHPGGNYVQSIEGRYKDLADGLGCYMLEVINCEECDQGIWKCIAVNDNLSVAVSSCDVKISIPKNYRKPYFVEKLKAVLTENGLVSFECKVVGFPTPQLRWFKDGSELKAGDIYQLTGVSSLGSYLCIAKNCMGEAKSDAELTVDQIQQQLTYEETLMLDTIRKPPAFVKKLISTDAPIDSEYRFIVQVNAPPMPKVQWFRSKNLITFPGKYTEVLDTDGTCTLIVARLALDDQNEWKCVATNEFGKTECSCYLKLTIPKHYRKPRFLENLRAVISDNGIVNLECKVIGVPQPTLKWYKDNVELKPGDIHKIMSGQDGTCCLGVYTCEARNCMGVVTSSASVHGIEDAVQAKVARKLSLSTINEEDTFRTASEEPSITVDNHKHEISYSFDGKEISISLYDTPDLTNEEALKIVEMYADQLSEHVSEHNVLELPPLRIVKETSTASNIFMEGVVVDILPEYFTVHDDDRTEADIDEISVLEDTLNRSKSFPKSTTCPDDQPTQTEPPKRKSSDSIKSPDMYYSMSEVESEFESAKTDVNYKSLIQNSNNQSRVFNDELFATNEPVPIRSNSQFLTLLLSNNLTDIQQRMCHMEREIHLQLMKSDNESLRKSLTIVEEMIESVQCLRAYFLNLNKNESQLNDVEQLYAAIVKLQTSVDRIHETILANEDASLQKENVKIVYQTGETMLNILDLIADLMKLDIFSISSSLATNNVSKSVIINDILDVRDMLDDLIKVTETILVENDDERSLLLTSDDFGTLNNEEVLVIFDSPLFADDGYVVEESFHSGLMEIHDENVAAFLAKNETGEYVHEVAVDECGGMVLSSEGYTDISVTKQGTEDVNNKTDDQKLTEMVSVNEYEEEKARIIEDKFDVKPTIEVVEKKQKPEYDESKEDEEITKQNTDVQDVEERPETILTMKLNDLKLIIQEYAIPEVSEIANMIIDNRTIETNRDFQEILEQTAYTEITTIVSSIFEIIRTWEQQTENSTVWRTDSTESTEPIEQSELDMIKHLTDQVESVELTEGNLFKLDRLIGSLDLLLKVGRLEREELPDQMQDINRLMHEIESSKDTARVPIFINMIKSLIGDVPNEGVREILEVIYDNIEYIEDADVQNELRQVNIVDFNEVLDGFAKNAESILKTKNIAQVKTISESEKTALIDRIVKLRDEVVNESVDGNQLQMIKTIFKNIEEYEVAGEAQEMETIQNTAIRQTISHIQQTDVREMFETLLETATSLDRKLESCEIVQDFNVPQMKELVVRLIESQADEGVEQVETAEVKMTIERDDMKELKHLKGILEEIDSNVVEEQAVEASVEAMVEALVEASVGASVEASREAPVEASVGASGEASVEASREAPVEASVGASGEAAGEALVEAPVGASVEASVEALGEASVEAPVKASVEASVGASVEASVEALVKAPVEASMEASAKPSVEGSVNASVEASVKPSVEPSAAEQPINPRIKVLTFLINKLNEEEVANINDQTVQKMLERVNSYEKGSVSNESINLVTVAFEEVNLPELEELCEILLESNLSGEQIQKITEKINSSEVSEFVKNILDMKMVLVGCQDTVERNNRSCEVVRGQERGSDQESLEILAKDGSETSTVPEEVILKNEASDASEVLKEPKEEKCHTIDSEVSTEHLPLKEASTEELTEKLTVEKLEEASLEELHLKVSTEQSNLKAASSAEIILKDTPTVEKQLEEVSREEQQLIVATEQVSVNVASPEEHLEPSTVTEKPKQEEVLPEKQQMEGVTIEQGSLTVASTEELLLKEPSILPLEEISTEQQQVHTEQLSLKVVSAEEVLAKERLTDEKLQLEEASIDEQQLKEVHTEQLVVKEASADELDVKEVPIVEKQTSDDGKSVRNNQEVSIETMEERTTITDERVVDKPAQEEEQTLRLSTGERTDDTTVIEENKEATEIEEYCVRNETVEEITKEISEAPVIIETTNQVGKNLKDKVTLMKAKQNINCLMSQDKQDIPSIIVKVNKQDHQVHEDLEAIEETVQNLLTTSDITTFGTLIEQIFKVDSVEVRQLFESLLNQTILTDNIIPDSIKNIQDSKIRRIAESLVKITKIYLKKCEEDKQTAMDMLQESIEQINAEETTKEDIETLSTFNETLLNMAKDEDVESLMKVLSERIEREEVIKTLNEFVEASVLTNNQEELLDKARSIVEPSLKQVTSTLVKILTDRGVVRKPMEEEVKELEEVKIDGEIEELRVVEETGVECRAVDEAIVDEGLRTGEEVTVEEKTFAEAETAEAEIESMIPETTEATDKIIREEVEREDMTQPLALVESTKEKSICDVITEEILQEQLAKELEQNRKLEAIKEKMKLLTEVKAYDDRKKPSDEEGDEESKESIEVDRQEADDQTSSERLSTAKETLEDLPLDFKASVGEEETERSVEERNKISEVGKAVSVDGEKRTEEKAEEHKLEESLIEEVNFINEIADMKQAGEEPEAVQGEEEIVGQKPMALQTKEVVEKSKNERGEEPESKVAGKAKEEPKIVQSEEEMAVIGQKPMAEQTKEVVEESKKESGEEPESKVPEKCKTEVTEEYKPAHIEEEIVEELEVVGKPKVLQTEKVAEDSKAPKDDSKSTFFKEEPAQAVEVVEEAKAAQDKKVVKEPKPAQPKEEYAEESKEKEVTEETLPLETPKKDKKTATVKKHEQEKLNNAKDLVEKINIELNNPERNVFLENFRIENLKEALEAVEKVKYDQEKLLYSENIFETAKEAITRLKQPLVVELCEILLTCEDLEIHNQAESVVEAVESSALKEAIGMLLKNSDVLMKAIVEQKEEGLDDASEGEDISEETDKIIEQILDEERQNDENNLKKRAEDHRLSNQNYPTEEDYEELLKLDDSTSLEDDKLSLQEAEEIFSPQLLQNLTDEVKTLDRVEEEEEEEKTQSLEQQEVKETIEESKEIAKTQEEEDLEQMRKIVEEFQRKQESMEETPASKESREIADSLERLQKIKQSIRQLLEEECEKPQKVVEKNIAVQPQVGVLSESEEDEQDSDGSVVLSPEEELTGKKTTSLEEETAVKQSLKPQVCEEITGETKPSTQAVIDVKEDPKQAEISQSPITKETVKKNKFDGNRRQSTVEETAPEPKQAKLLRKDTVEQKGVEPNEREVQITKVDVKSKRGSISQSDISKEKAKIVTMEDKNAKVEVIDLPKVQTPQRRDSEIIKMHVEEVQPAQGKAVKVETVEKTKLIPEVSESTIKKEKVIVESLDKRLTQRRTSIVETLEGPRQGLKEESAITKHKIVKRNVSPERVVDITVEKKTLLKAERSVNLEKHPIAYAEVKVNVNVKKPTVTVSALIPANADISESRIKKERITEEKMTAEEKQVKIRSLQNKTLTAEVSQSKITKEVKEMKVVSDCDGKKLQTKALAGVQKAEMGFIEYEEEGEEEEKAAEIKKEKRLSVTEIKTAEALEAGVTAEVEIVKMIAETFIEPTQVRKDEGKESVVEQTGRKEQESKGSKEIKQVEVTSVEIKNEKGTDESSVMKADVQVEESIKKKKESVSEVKDTTAKEETAMKSEVETKIKPGKVEEKEAIAQQTEEVVVSKKETSDTKVTEKRRSSKGKQSTNEGNSEAIKADEKTVKLTEKLKHSKEAEVNMERKDSEVEAKIEPIEEKLTKDEGESKKSDVEPLKIDEDKGLTTKPKKRLSKEDIKETKTGDEQKPKRKSLKKEAVKEESNVERRKSQVDQEAVKEEAKVIVKMSSEETTTIMKDEVVETKEKEVLKEDNIHEDNVKEVKPETKVPEAEQVVKKVDVKAKDEVKVEEAEVKETKAETEKPKVAEVVKKDVKTKDEVEVAETKKEPKSQTEIPKVEEVAKKDVKAKDEVKVEETKVKESKTEAEISKVEEVAKKNVKAKDKVKVEDTKVKEVVVKTEETKKEEVQAKKSVETKEESFVEKKNVQETKEIVIDVEKPVEKVKIETTTKVEANKIEANKVEPNKVESNKEPTKGPSIEPQTRASRKQSVKEEDPKPKESIKTKEKSKPTEENDSKTTQKDKRRKSSSTSIKSVEVKVDLKEKEKKKDEHVKKERIKLEKSHTVEDINMKSRMGVDVKITKEETKQNSVKQDNVRQYQSTPRDSTRNNVLTNTSTETRTIKNEEPLQKPYTTKQQKPYTPRTKEPQHNDYYSSERKARINRLQSRSDYETKRINEEINRIKRNHEENIARRSKDEKEYKESNKQTSVHVMNVSNVSRRYQPQTPETTTRKPSEETKQDNRTITKYKDVYNRNEEQQRIKKILRERSSHIHDLVQTSHQISNDLITGLGDFGSVVKRRTRTNDSTVCSTCTEDKGHEYDFNGHHNLQVCRKCERYYKDHPRYRTTSSLTTSSQSMRMLQDDLHLKRYMEDLYTRRYNVTMYYGTVRSNELMERSVTGYRRCGSEQMDVRSLDVECEATKGSLVAKRCVPRERIHNEDTWRDRNVKVVASNIPTDVVCVKEQTGFVCVKVKPLESRLRCLNEPDSLITVLPGQDIVVAFRVNDGTNPKIAWKKRDVDVTKSNRFRSESYGNIRRLILKNAQFDDIGTYSINVDDETGSRRLFVTVTINDTMRNLTYYRLIRNQCTSVIRQSQLNSSSRLLYTSPIPSFYNTYVSSYFRSTSIPRPLTPTNPLTHPRFYTRPQNAIVEPGESVRFQLSCGGFPEPTVTWYRGNQEVFPSERVRTIERFNTKILEIANVSARDVGTYRMVIHNAKGFEEATARLDMLAVRPTGRYRRLKY